MTTRTPLTWKHFPAGQDGFFRSPVLLAGATEAVLIDGGFTLSDGQALATAVAEGNTALKAIYVSQSDPDYYFSLAPVHARFPGVPVLAASDTLAAIEASVQKKLAAWGPQLKENGPQCRADIVFPTAFDAPALAVDGEQIEIIQATGLANRRYLWVPSLGAIFGGVMVFSGVHVWTADTATPALRAAWIANLDAMAARQPRIVVAGHATADAPTDASGIAYTRSYLLAFEEELAKAADSTALIAAMKQRYPQAGMDVALNIGAKVALGEMPWG